MIQEKDSSVLRAYNPEAIEFEGGSTSTVETAAERLGVSADTDTTEVPVAYKTLLDITDVRECAVSQ